MKSRTARSGSVGLAGAVFLYDGDCGFCTRCATFLSRHVPTVVRVVPWRWVDLAPLRLTAAECSAAVQFVAAGRVSAGPLAIADVLRTASGAWGPAWRVLGRMLAARPVLALAWPVYRWVARHRHRFPGGSASCEIPQRNGA